MREPRKPLKFALPEQVGVIARATRELRDHYSASGLEFTPDGKFVGDLGEAIAAEMFDITLRQGKGIDGYYGDIPVQVKLTGRPKGGAVFRDVDENHPANTHLVVYFIDWAEGVGELLYNGPEVLVRPNCKGSQREASRHKLLTVELGETESMELPINKEFQARYIR